MIMRWIGFLLAILCGIGAGLFYGWVINPPEHAGLSPESLRIDFRTDYVLMTAEAFSGENNLAEAIKRLAVFERTSPMEITLQALIFAQEIGYTDADLAKLQDLLTEIQAYTFSQEKLTP